MGFLQKLTICCPLNIIYFWFEMITRQVFSLFSFVPDYGKMVNTGQSQPKNTNKKLVWKI